MRSKTVVRKTHHEKDLEKVMKTKDLLILQQQEKIKELKRKLNERTSKLQEEVLYGEANYEMADKVYIRYLGGDTTLFNEIEDNASSYETQNILARFYLEKKRSAKKTSTSLLKLPKEILSQIQMHLHPMYITNLAQVNKLFKRVCTTNEEYWARVALHRMTRFRMIRGYYVEYVDNEDEIVVSNEWGLTSKFYHMINVDEGYYKAMDQFIEKIPLMFTKELEKVRNKEQLQKYQKYLGKSLASIQSLSVDELVRYIGNYPNGYFLGCAGLVEDDGSFVEVDVMTMRAVAKKTITSGAPEEELDKRLWRWVKDLHHNQSITTTQKKKLITGLMKALHPWSWKLDESMIRETGCESSEMFSILQALRF